MNEVQNIIDRQLGLYSRFNYDNVLKRLSVHCDESFYGLQNNTLPPDFDQDPPIFACRFSEAPGYEHVLALANEDGRVAIQDTRTMETTKKLEGFQCHNNAVFDLVWMPLCMKFVTVSGDHTACLWDVSGAGPRREASFTGHSRSVKTAAFPRREPRVFASGARDGRVLLWDARAPQRPQLTLEACHAERLTPRARRPAPRRALSITGLVFRDDVTLVSCGECDGTIKVWDTRKSYSVHKREPLPSHSIPYCGSSTRNGYTNLIVDEAGVRLYASCMDDVVYCFNVSTFNSLPEQRYVGHENSTFYIKTGLSPDGAYLVSGSSDKHAYVWNVKCSQPVVRLSGHRAEVTCAAWCARGDVKLATCSDDARHKIWRVGRELPPLGEDGGRAELTPRTDDKAAPRWGTPASLKRRAATDPPAKRLHPAPRTKRCLADLMCDDAGAKRVRLEPTIPEEDERQTGDGAAPRWGTPASLKRRAATDPPAPRTKRCLADLMCGREPDEAPEEARRSLKRVRLEATIPEEDERQTGEGDCESTTRAVKRPNTPTNDSTPPKRKCAEADNWTYFSPKASTSFMTPTKNYEKRNCKILSPRSPKTLSPSDANRTPVKNSPPTVKIIRFNTPTKDLPNFVLTGEAPHLRLMSPVRKKRETTDWLTLMVREKKSKTTEGSDKTTNVTLASPKDPAPTRRNSTTEKTPKSNSKNRSILKYFNVSKKDK